MTNNFIRQGALAGGGSKNTHTKISDQKIMVPYETSVNTSFVTHIQKIAHKSTVDSDDLIDDRYD